MEAKISIVIAALLALLAPVAASQTLQLKGGQVLLAEVEDAHGEGLRVRRLDNGGVLDLRWEDLATECANRIKQAYDLAGEGGGEVMVKAQLVTYRQGGIEMELIGRVEEGTNPLEVRSKGLDYRIPRDNVVGVRPVEVPVSQVFTREEWYGKRLAELDPGTLADKHILFAEELIQVRDYEHAEYHLDRAEELGNTRAPAKLAGMKKKLERYKAAAKEREMLDRIQIARARGGLEDFERGVELIARYEEEFPDSRLRSEFEQEKRRFDQARTRFLTGKVADTWRRLIRSIAERRVAQGDLTLATAREYAEREMHDDLAARTAEVLDLEPAEVEELWGKRVQYPAFRRPEYFYYGIGSWVLGEAAILKDTKQGEVAGAEPTSSRDREIERLARMIKEARERASRQRGGGQAGGEESEEDWWQGASRNEKTGWLRAYYAEFSGDMVVESAYVKECVNCGGTGTEVVLGQSGKPETAKCFLCHGTKALRSIRAY